MQSMLEVVKVLEVVKGVRRVLWVLWVMLCTLLCILAVVERELLVGGTRVMRYVLELRALRVVSARG